MCIFQDLATAMDDGTAGEMVASCNYWGAMSATTSKRHSRYLDEQSASPETGDEISGREQGKRGGSGDGGGGGGDGHGMAVGSSPAILCAVDWAAIRLKSGNVKVEASASAAEASHSFCRRSWSNATEILCDCFNS